MQWQTPTFREIAMNSEIGGYQDEFDERKAGDAANSELFPHDPIPVDRPTAAG